MILSDTSVLTFGSKKEISIMCDYCNNTYNKSYQKYNYYGDRSIVNKDACKHCNRIKNIEIKLKKLKINQDAIDFIVNYTINHRECKISGIYLIKNEIENKVYIGSTSNIIKRWVGHIEKIKNGNHHSKSLMNDVVKNGIESFSFEILEVVNENLTELEYDYIRRYESYGDNGYNTFKRKVNKIDKGIRTEKERVKLKELNIGENANGVKLKNKNVLRIKNMLINGVSQKEIASKFGVKDATINDIKNLRTWVHIAPELNDDLKNNKANRQGVNNSCSKLTEKQVVEIKKRIKDNESNMIIAKDYHVSRTLISHIKNGKLWSHIKIS